MRPATIRSRVRLPMELADGLATEAEAVSFDGLVDGRGHVALLFGGPPTGPAPLVRLHSECLTGDVLGSQRCDCGPQLRESVARLSEAGGVLLYLRQEGRGIGLYPKLEAYQLQDGGLDTYQANVALGYGPDERDYTVAAQMLVALGLGAVTLLTNNPDKVAQLTALGIDVVRQVPTWVHLNGDNAAYLAAKAEVGAHTLDLLAGEGTG